MEEKEAEGLYDYLYKDRSKISSYYAQLFKGLLTSREHKSSTSEASEDDISLSVTLLKGKFKGIQTATEEESRSIDPHDFLTTDLLSYLMDHGMIQTNFWDAAHHKIALIKGNIVFIDNTIIDILIDSYDYFFDSMTPQQIGAKNEKEKKNIGKIAKTFKKVLSHNPFQPAFILKTEDGRFVTGTLRDEFMAEPVLSLYLKHGAKGLADVYVIGIKEESNSLSFESQTPFLDAGGQFAGALNQLIFPTGAVHLSPIVMFRKIF